jgi:diguanylate cyclase (GGDEF)-like protein
MDTKTIWVALAISNLVFGLLMLVYAGSVANRSIIRNWAIAQLVKGIGIALIVLKAALPFPWSFGGNILYMVGHFLELAAFLAYAGRAEYGRSALAVLLALLAVYLAPVAALGRGIDAKYLAVSFSLCLFILYSLNAAALMASRRGRSAVQGLLVASNGLIALTALIRAAVAWNSDGWNPQSTAFTNQMLFVAGYVFSLTDGFGFLLLVKEDADRDLRRMATTDELTGLSNRASFMTAAEDRFRLCRRTGQPAALIMMDLDHFKRINDTFGHPAGDEALRSVGRVIRQHLRDVDVCGRLGGEEFAAMLPGTALDAALHVAERLRLALAGSSVAFEGRQIRLTVSLGLAAMDNCDSLQQAMREADSRLYRAKTEGRNRVVATG